MTEIGHFSETWASQDQEGKRVCPSKVLPPIPNPEETAIYLQRDTLDRQTRLRNHSIPFSHEGQIIYNFLLMGVAFVKVQSRQEMV